ncbi:DNA-binding protein [Wenjunlia vitaminophila]|uniref:DNA-binding protein n=1 Tax=Wenjunlia vitaminophila TaxID=76728 RepID=A0A0T6LM33_WENVI|nr:helix-turn-helix transcriptional regulator [Wenjunlia vitaminophila]KRV47146.1 DNA-binding protein [Wenjunlia vitaminophila]
MARRTRTLTPDRSVRHLFGAEARRLREQANMSLEQLADVVNFSKSHLARIELAEYMPPPDLPARLDAAFDTDGLFGRLYSIARREVHPDKYRRRMELEARARIIEEYAGHIVPGIVQTEAYARALFLASNPKATADAIEERVAARMSRQEVLRSSPAPDVSIILDEAVIRRPVGGPDVMRAQLSLLIDMVDTPTSVVQVLPFAHGEHGLLGGTLTLMTLDDDTRVAYEESIDTGQLLEDPESVSTRHRAYDLLRAYALSPLQTVAFIRSAMETLPS